MPEIAVLAKKVIVTFVVQTVVFKKYSMQPPVVAQLQQRERIQRPSSTTITQSQHPIPREEEQVVMVRLIAEPQPRSHISWSDDVVDNEHMGKKKSKSSILDGFKPTSTMVRI